MYRRYVYGFLRVRELEEPGLSVLPMFFFQLDGRTMNEGGILGKEKE